MSRKKVIAYAAGYHKNSSTPGEIKFKPEDTPIVHWEDLPLDKYIAVLETLSKENVYWNGGTLYCLPQTTGENSEDVEDMDELNIINPPTEQA